MNEKKNFIINTLYIGIIVAIVFLVYKYLLPIVLPFIIGFLFAYITNKISKNLCKTDNKYIKCLVLVLLYGIISVVGFGLTVKAFDRTIDFIKGLPSFYSDVLVPSFNNLVTQLKAKLATTNIDFGVIEEYVSIASSSLADGLSELIGKIVTFITDIAKKTPSAIISTIVCIVTSFYFVLDYEGLICSIGRLFSDKTKKTIKDFEYFVTVKLFKIICSYLLIMLITYGELLLGFVILKIDMPLLVAGFVAIVDIMPVLGTGTILIPWSIIELVIGNYGLGIKIFVLYLIITIIRNIIEPKMVGEELKLHPLLTLFTMMIGINVFGIIGMIAIPLILSFINNQREESEIGKDVKEKQIIQR